MKHVTLKITALLFLSSFCDAYAVCMPFGNVITQPIAVPNELGIKRIVFVHSRDQNTAFHGRVYGPPGIAEPYSSYLENRDVKVFEPTDPRIRSGVSGVTTQFDIMGQWYYTSSITQPLGYDLKNTEQYRYYLFWTSCGDEFPNTGVIFEYSNYDGPLVPAY